jgi:hypothetical protein
MSQTRQKASPTDSHAKRIAQAIAKGRPPPFSDVLDRYCESSPREIFAAFAGAARHMPPAGRDQPLALGYLFLLQRLLEHLRYRTDAGYEDAARLIAEFQADVVAQVEAGSIDASMLSFVAVALHQSKIPASPELTAASAKQPLDPDEDEALPAEIHSALAGILEACDGDPFLAVGSLVESGHAMPVETRGAVAVGLAIAGIADARAAAILFLLDPEPAVRRAVAGALARDAASLAPTELRRLIAMRNWRPENERAEVDAIIRKARAAGVACAPWAAGGLEEIVATAIDGVMAQGFLLLSPSGRKKRMSSILIKNGIADAWSGEPESRRQIEESLAAAAMGAPALAVTRSYLDRTVAHQMALGIEEGKVPPFGLLEAAETIGGADWHPLRMDFGTTLAGLIAEVPAAMRAPAAVASVLRRSNQLADLVAVAQSWFEDDPHIAQTVEQAGGRDRAKLAAFLLQGALAKRRDRWAEIVLRTALWMHAAPEADELCWRELAIVAKALADGRDITEIGLMHDIAWRTIAALRGAGRVNRAAYSRQA